MIGLLSAFEVAADLDRYFGFVLDLVCAVVVAWCAFQVSKRLRLGNVLCAGVACAWCVAWAGIVAFEELPKALRVNLDFASVFYTAIGGSLSVIPIVFCLARSPCFPSASRVPAERAERRRPSRASSLGRRVVHQEAFQARK
jgi:hypothetical protein